MLPAFLSVSPSDSAPRETREQGFQIDELMIQRFLYTDEIRLVKSNHIRDFLLTIRPRVDAIPRFVVTNVEGQDA
jgi:hypothetical protein